VSHLTLFIASVSVGLWLSTASALGGVCDSEKGVNLANPPGPYQYLTPTHQGRLGTCFAHSATNLLRSYSGVSDYVNIIDAATISDSGVDGGSVDDVVDGFMERNGPCYKSGKSSTGPWMCKDNGGQFSNLFPSPDQNILTELEKILLNVPVHYTMDPNSKAGIDRTRQISDLAIKMAKGQVQPCKIVNPRNQFYDQYLALMKKVSAADDRLKKLEDEKSAYGTEWLWTTFGYRSNADIQKDINAKKSEKKDLEAKMDHAHSVYTEKDAKLNAGRLNFSYLDGLSVNEAAEIVYYWSKDAYRDFKDVFKKYGIEKYAGTIDQFIKERAERDPVKGFQYAGPRYAYKMVKKAIEAGCPVTERICLDKNIRMQTLRPKSAGYDAVKNKIESLLTQSKPQGVGISLDVSVLDGTSRGPHAVNIVGCRTVQVSGYPQKQYLIHNSWGTSCSSYSKHLQTSDRCSMGRVWVNENSVISSATEIQWIGK
jgi:hypothetical protein